MQKNNRIFTADYVINKLKGYQTLGTNKIFQEYVFCISTTFKWVLTIKDCYIF